MSEKMNIPEPSEYGETPRSDAEIIKSFRELVKRVKQYEIYTEEDGKNLGTYNLESNDRNGNAEIK